MLVEETILSPTKNSNAQYLVNYNCVNTFILSTTTQLVGLGDQPTSYLPLASGRSPIKFDKEITLLKDGINQGTSRFINSASNDYEVDENGSLKGMQSSFQLVQLALKTEKESSSVPGFGIPFTKNQMAVGSSSKIKQDILTTLSHIKSIIIKEISVIKEQSKFNIIIKYIDKNTNKLQMYEL